MLRLFWFPKMFLLGLKRKFWELKQRTSEMIFSQVDNPRLDERYNGLVYLSEKMKGDPLCWQVTLDETESVRGELARVAARKL